LRNFLFPLIALFIVTSPALSRPIPSSKADAGSAGRATAPLVEEIADGKAFSFVYDGKRSQGLLAHWRSRKPQSPWQTEESYELSHIAIRQPGLKLPTK